MSELNREDKTVPVNYQSTEEKVIDICCFASIKTSMI
jgi:hypothetical protein